MDLYEASAIIRLLSVGGVGNAIARRVLNNLRSRGLLLSEVYEARDVEPLRAILDQNKIDEFLGTPKSIDQQIEALSEQRVSFISFLDLDYPQCLANTLKDNAPILLSLRGNRELLKTPTVGFCGSRKASDKGLATARDCAEQIVAAHVSVASGYASGVDVAAHLAALEAKGATIVVLPEGILKFRVRAELQGVWDWDRILVVSQFLPGLPWSARQAMDRNKTIIGISHAMIVIESGETGGTMEAGRTTLELRRPVYAAMYEEMPESAIGNRQLISMGAKPLMKSRSTGRASIARLLEDVQLQYRQGCVTQEQLVLRISSA